MPLFAVINTRGPAYRHGAPLEEQEAWRPHLPVTQLAAAKPH